MATQFTFPYVGLRRRASGQLDSTLGAFVLLNDEGWALTAAHVVDEIVSVQREIEAGTPPPSNPDDPCTHHVEVWAVPGFDRVRPGIAEAIVRGVADLAVVKLDPFDPGCVEAFATLRDAVETPVSQGMSVCRFGYPFHTIEAGWDEARGEFVLPDGAFPVASFALDGIVSRFHRTVAEDGNEATFIATSTPGLRGHSGGPLLDVEGRVCGIQSHTTHLDLGFEGHFSAGERVVAERQFLNVGAATHVSDVRGVLDEAGITYRAG
jgi:hypothetical protein